MKLENLDVVSATQIVQENNLKARIIKLDDPMSVVATADIREDRVNLLVKDGKVVGTSRG
jgi:hypothetical protein